ncbi:TetR/AcrR family transcriptional regulator [bacterium]|nr:TetR/AcrR family transcriptional regulator [bacterium]
MQEKQRSSTKKQFSQVKNKNLVAKKHEQIVKAAGELFSLKGYHRTTLRDIAKASGINLSYLYKYISSKDDIFYLFFQQMMHEIHDWYKPYLDENGKIDEDTLKGENPIYMLKTIIKNVLEGIYRINNEMLTLLTETRHMQDDFLKIILAEESNNIALMEQVIEKGVKEGYFKTDDVKLTANYISHLLLIHPLRSWNFKNHCTFRRFEESLTEFILKALDVTTPTD